jgi:hypothetical protein
LPRAVALLWAHQKVCREELKSAIVEVSGTLQTIAAGNQPNISQYAPFRRPRRIFSATGFSPFGRHETMIRDS